jgi:hypothetical protein
MTMIDNGARCATSRAAFHPAGPARGTDSGTQDSSHVFTEAGRGLWRGTDQVPRLFEHSNGWLHKRPSVITETGQWATNDRRGVVAVPVVATFPYCAWYGNPENRF